MVNNIKKLLNTFQKIEKQRTIWIRLSIITAVIMLGIVLDWSYIATNPTHLWIIFTLGLLLSVIWWIWTMRLIKVLLDTKQNLLSIMLELTKNISETRLEILKRRNTDK